jgi:dTDP-4-dehydrorhamnose 3,5-epimerase
MPAKSITAGAFTFTSVDIEGPVIVDTTIHEDERGYFTETYKRPDFVAGGIDAEFVQDNQSHSCRGVLRGLHFQVGHPQARLVRVLSGEIFDVAVDLRPDSPSYGRWHGVTLSRANHRQFFIPRGFAHGFLVLSESATIAYKCDEVYHPEDEAGYRWDDPSIGIEWPPLPGDEALDPTKLILSAKDQAYPPFVR